MGFSRTHGMEIGHHSLVVAVAGHLSSGTDIDITRTQVGNISLLAHIPYWSVTDKTWDTLSCLRDKLARSRSECTREDFTSPELRGTTALFLDH